VNCWRIEREAASRATTSLLAVWPLFAVALRLPLYAGLFAV